MANGGGTFGMREVGWLFLGFSGRLSRQPYALAGLLLYLLRMYPVYRMLGAADEATATYWAGILVSVVVILLPAHIALSAKRLHDFGVTGWIALFYIFGDIIAYLLLCAIPGTQGPNRHGDRTNAPFIRPD